MERKQQKGDTVFLLCPNCNLVGFNSKKCVVCSHEFDKPKVLTLLKKNNEVYDLSGLNISYPRFPPACKKKEVHRITSKQKQTPLSGRKQYASYNFNYSGNQKLFELTQSVIFKQQNEETEEQKRRKKCSFGTYWKYCSRCNSELHSEHRINDNGECTRRELSEGLQLKLKNFEQAVTAIEQEKMAMKQRKRAIMEKRATEKNAMEIEKKAITEKKATELEKNAIIEKRAMELEKNAIIEKRTMELEKTTMEVEKRPMDQKTIIKRRAIEQERESTIKKKVTEEERKNIIDSINLDHTYQLKREGKNYSSYSSIQNASANMTRSQEKIFGGNKIKVYNVASFKMPVTTDNITTIVSTNKLSDTFDKMHLPKNVPKNVHNYKSINYVSVKKENEAHITSASSNKIPSNSFGQTHPPVNVAKIIDKSKSTEPVFPNKQHAAGVTAVSSIKKSSDTLCRTQASMNVAKIVDKFISIDSVSAQKQNAANITSASSTKISYPGQTYPSMNLTENVHKSQNIDSVSSKKQNAANITSVSPTKILSDTLGQTYPSIKSKENVDKSKSIDSVSAQKQNATIDITSTSSTKLASDTICRTERPTNVVENVDKSKSINSVSAQKQDTADVPSVSSSDTLGVTESLMNVAENDKSKSINSVSSEKQNATNIMSASSTKISLDTSSQTCSSMNVTKTNDKSSINLKSEKSMYPIVVLKDICSIQKEKFLVKNKAVIDPVQEPTDSSFVKKEVNMDTEILKSIKNEDNPIKKEENPMEHDVKLIMSEDKTIKKEEKVIEIASAPLDEVSQMLTNLVMNAEILKSMKNEDKEIAISPVSSKEVPANQSFVKKERNVDVKLLKPESSEDNITTDMPASPKEFPQELIRSSDDTKPDLKAAKDEDNQETEHDSSDDEIIIIDDSDEDSQDLSQDSKEKRISVEDSQNTQLPKKSPKYPDIKPVDLDSLEERTYINDTVIEFYLNYIYYEKLSPELQEKTYICNTNFYQKLVEEEAYWQEKNKAPEKTLEEHWLKKVDLFSKDFIVIPMNCSNVHWYLVIICYLSKLGNTLLDIKEDKLHNTRAQSKLKQSLKDSQKPCICFFDSSGYRDGLSEDRLNVGKNLRDYLQRLRLRKKNQQPCSWKQVRFVNVICPQQQNGYDCGIFLLQFAESFFETPITDFEGSPDVTHWFNHNKIKDNRKKIKKIILQITDKIKKNCTS